MQNSYNKDAAEKLTPLPTAAKRFGYLDAQHFRQEIAPRHGIHPVQQGTRWFVWQSQLDRALANLALTSTTSTT